MTLPISLTFAAAAALIHIWLSLRVSQLRRRHRISVGDGDNPVVRTRMRSHANFAENTPIFLVLLALVELARGSATWLWTAAILYILSRIAHAFGMDRPAPNVLRVAGVMLSWLVLLVLASFALYVASTYQPASSPLLMTPDARP
jgi:uncharacterized protein